ncbi:unnamed protein product [Adineta steineri]|uniref:Uncharacterized protein n=1 Tax=Adineta steineri TaxID=433720 RepID=A0A815WLB5_9BILA|nr:unnamed protein product [Adineta steineri]
MKIKDFFDWIENKLKNHNVFIPDEDDYEDENDEPQDPAIVLKHQLYATRLYTILFIVLIFIFALIAFTNPQSQLVTISNITPSLFNELRLEHDETLSCPCLNSIISYNKFVSNHATFHPICESIFVSEKWIQALYDPMASKYLIMDFRTTAHAQFKFLANFCSLSKDTVSQTLADLEHTQFFSNELLPEHDVQSEVKKTVEVAVLNSSIQVTPLLQLTQIITQSDAMVSGLNTNVLFRVVHFSSISEKQRISTKCTGDHELHNPKLVRICDHIGSVTPAGFYAEPFDKIALYHDQWPMNSSFRPIAVSTVDGFFGGCTALNATLASTFDCLYNIKCLENFTDYFPNLTKMRLNWSDSVLTSSRKSIQLRERLVNFLVENLSIQINYSNYFNECALSTCTYTIISRANFSDTIALLLSLYGGLTIILRLIVPLLINLLSKFKQRSRNTNVNFVHCIRRLGRYIGKLNFFKTANDRTTKTIRQQRITTRVYMLFLANANKVFTLSVVLVSIVILVVFTLLNTRTITATESSPSLDKYKQLQLEYPNTTKCPCSHSENRYETFVSFYHRLHQVCSSDFVNDSWISMLALLGSDKDVFDWEHSAASGFRLISNLCQLAQKTINDTVQRLSTRSFITPNSLTEYNLKSQLETILAKFDQSIIMQFNILINTMHLLIEVDQPFSNSENVALKQNRCYNSDGGRERIQDLTTHDASDYRCFCVTEFDCTHSMKYLLYNGTHYEAELRIDPVPGAIRACFIIDSVLLSTLEYLYVPECLSSILHIVNASWAYNKNVTKLPYFNPRPLIHDSMTSRFPPKAPFSTLVKEMMIEEWNQTFSFEKYYNACAPNYCKYSYEESTQSFIEVIIKVVSTISGLTMVLRLITNQLIKLIFRLFKPKVQRQEQGNYTFGIE